MLYLEAALDIPNGAQVQEVTFIYRDCDYRYLKFYFGAYNPSSSSFEYYTQGNLVQSTNGPSCTTTTSMVVPLTSQPTITNGQKRYVLGVDPNGLFFTDTYDPTFVTNLLIGARVGYTIPAAYIPYAIKSGASSW
jgi:hypothetical protein